MTPRDLPASSGVYIIVNMRTADFYLGSSVDIRARVFEHYRQLRLGTHYNERLQRSWRKYGDLEFVCDVVELTTVAKLRKREQFHFDETKTWSAAFNMRRTADLCGTPGQRNGHAKLTELQVLRVKLAYKHNKRRHGLGAAFARELGVGFGAVSAIANGRNWKHVSV